MNVYIVEDSLSIQQFMESTVLECGGQVAGIADTVEAAVAGIFTSKPDMVILDLWLKQGQSLEVVREVKRALPDVTIVVLTNRSAQLYKKPCLDMGADYFLQKNANDYRALRGLLTRFACC